LWRARHSPTESQCQSGVTINSGNNAGIAVISTGTQILTVTAQAGTTINVGANNAIQVAAANNGSAAVNTAANITAQFTAIDVFASGSVSVVNSGQITTLGATTDVGIYASAAHGSMSILNSGTINSSGAGISVTSGANATVSMINSGQITGNIGVAMYEASGATLTNTGTIIGTSGIAIQNASIFFTALAGSTINLDGGAVVGSLLLSSAADVLNIRGGTLAGSIIGSGTSDTINFALGSNTFTYGAAYGFNTINQVNVLSGTVILDGANSATNISITGGNLQVGDAANPGAALTGAVGVSGGMLSGFGTVIGNVSIGNGGALAPGGQASPGTLTVQGNLVFATAASYLVSISSNVASRTAVTGTATLAGTVAVTSPAGSYRFNTPYTILTSGGLGGTQFNTLVMPSAGISGSLLYPNGTDVQLVLNSNLGGVTGLNGNQRAVAAVLDAGFNARGTSGNLGSIFNGNIPLNLTQASGETAVGAQQTTFDAMSQFMSLLTDPSIGERSGGASPGSGATPMVCSPRRLPRRSSSAGACGRRALADRKPPTAMRRLGPTPRPAVSQVPRWVPTTVSRRLPLPASRSRAAAPTSRSPMDWARAAQTCSRPAPSSATMSDRLTSPARWPMAGRISPPTAP
jgi:hypothetical protein